MNDKLNGEHGFGVDKQSLDVVAGDDPMLNTLAVNPTPWNICPVCKNQADVDDDASDGSQIQCHECKADLVVVEFGNPDGNGSVWELRGVDEKEGVAKTSTPVDAPDIVERCAVAFWECEWPTRSHAKFADESEDTREGIKGGVRAIIAELAAMGGEATTDLQAAEDALHRIVGTVNAIEKHNSHPKAMDDIRSEANGLIRFVEKSLLTIAAKDATIAEQAMEIGRLKADARIFELAGPAALYATTKLTGSVARAGDAMRAGRVILTGKALGVWEGYVLEYVTNLDKP